MLTETQAPEGADERAAFEKWISHQSSPLHLYGLGRDESDRYGVDIVQAAWWAWQARDALAAQPQHGWPVEEQPDGTVTPVDPADMPKGAADHLELFKEAGEWAETMRRQITPDMIELLGWLTSAANLWAEKIEARQSATQAPAEGDAPTKALERAMYVLENFPAPGETVSTTGVQTAGMALSELREWQGWFNREAKRAWGRGPDAEPKAQPKGTGAKPAWLAALEAREREHAASTSETDQEYAAGIRDAMTAYTINAAPSPAPAPERPTKPGWYVVLPPDFDEPKVRAFGKDGQWWIPLGKGNGDDGWMTGREYQNWVGPIADIDDRQPFLPEVSAPAVAPGALTGEHIDGIKQALLDTAKDPFDIEEADRIVERILSSFKPPVQGSQP